VRPWSVSINLSGAARRGCRRYNDCDCEHALQHGDRSRRLSVKRRRRCCHSVLSVAACLCVRVCVMWQLYRWQLVTCVTGTWCIGEYRVLGLIARWLRLILCRGTVRSTAHRQLFWRRHTVPAAVLVVTMAVRCEALCNWCCDAPIAPKFSRPLEFAPNSLRERCMSNRTLRT